MEPAPSEQRSRAPLVMLLLGLGPLACDGPAARSRPADGAAPAVATRATAGASGTRDAATRVAVSAGVDVLVESVPAELIGARVGLITNHTGRTADGTSTIDALHALPDIELAALFAPEHGLRGDVALDDLVASGTDPATGLPVHSLYGGADRRKPTPEQLRGLDALAFDIQDIGARPYTYVWTMALALEAAAENDLLFVVLDRPNPIGGDAVQGPIQDDEHLTFVGLHPVPLRHGLTAGELARFLVGERAIDARLLVVPARGWRRDLWFDDTGLTWRPPSPNMPTLESAAHYPGTVLLEGTNLSVGRGTEVAFQQVGAPWLDPERYAAAVRSAAGDGVRIEPVRFTPREPQDGKFAGREVGGVRLQVTDRAAYDPVRTGVALIVAARALAPEQFGWTGTIDRLIGYAAFREGVDAGLDAGRLTEAWPGQEERFRTDREPYLLYGGRP
jgi:uncharacterized protein YbbC (DUF1343 family)